LNIPLRAPAMVAFRLSITFHVGEKERERMCMCLSQRPCPHRWPVVEDVKGARSSGCRGRASLASSSTSSRPPAQGMKVGPQATGEEQGRVVAGASEGGRAGSWSPVCISFMVCYGSGVEDRTR
jgi:hypothetical protein